MKLKWKIFLAMLSVVMIMLCISASFLISVTFQSALDQEMVTAAQQNRLLRATLGYLLTSVPEEKWEADAEQVLTEIMGDLRDFSQEGSGSGLRLQLEDKVIQLEDRDLLGEAEQSIGTKLPAADELIQMVDLNETGHWVRTISMVEVNGTRVYLESWQNVNAVFQNREEQYHIYRLVMLTAAIGTGILGLIIAVWITRPIGRLSRVARSIAEGNMSARARTGSHDEVGLLAQDVNQMADRLEADIAYLQETNERQERFIGNFAHELKTPLTSIIGYADMLRLRKADPEFTMEAAGYIFSEGKRLERLSAKLLQIILLRQEELELKEIAGEELLRTTADIIRPMLKKKKLNLYWSAEAGLLLYGDEDLLRTVIMNLADNACKACAEGGSICISAVRQDDLAVLIVRDDGHGAAKSELTHLTEAFYMEDKSRSRNQGGSGLGLYLCAEIIKLHKGTIAFTSSPGCGMEVRVSLPQPEAKGEACDEG